MSSFFSPRFLVFVLPAIVLVYALLPKASLRRGLLLAASWGVFFLFSRKLLLFLLLVIGSDYGFGRWLSASQAKCAAAVKAAEKDRRKAIRRRFLRRDRLILALGILLPLGLLLVLKYAAFFLDNLNALFAAMGSAVTVRVPSFLLPIGISFYTMQAMSYLFDVYRKTLPAERNVLRLALYMSFFPQLMEGPICRYSETAQQLWAAEPLQWRNLLFGIQRIVWGVMKKVVIADRLNLLIETVFGDYMSYDGLTIALAAVCYTFQLYMDFSGTMDLVLGVGNIFGVQLPENFQRPFFSRTIPEFWKRWHITLGTWFRDYIFYPLSLSAPLKKLASRLRKHWGSHYGVLPSSAAALLCVWVCNGLWHGAGWNYLFFGLYHFALILMGNIIEPPALALTNKLGIRREGRPFRYFQIVRTSILVCIGELFFRANGLAAGLAMFRRIFTDFSFSAVKSGDILTYGMDGKDFLLVLLCAVGLFAVGIAQERGVHLRETLARRPMWLQFAVWYLILLFVIICGAYGAGYVPVDPIYANF